jgi:hypothetical protein
MKRITPLTLSVVLAAAACTDAPVERSATTAPGKARLTMSSLPAHASTVCVANVRARDEIVASSAAIDNRQAKLDALDVVIDDTCY